MRPRDQAPSLCGCAPRRGRPPLRGRDGRAMQHARRSGRADQAAREAMVPTALPATHASYGCVRRCHIGGPCHHATGAQRPRAKRAEGQPQHHSGKAPTARAARPRRRTNVSVVEGREEEEISTPLGSASARLLGCPTEPPTASQRGRRAAFTGSRATLPDTATAHGDVQRPSHATGALTLGHCLLVDHPSR
jgi:hypothetical protein